jgi:hypothetical protein
MKKIITATAVAALTTIGFSATAAAGGGNSEMGTLHPGHVGYMKTGGNGGGVPAAHFHDVAPSETGPGGWAALVTDTVKGAGNPHR